MNRFVPRLLALATGVVMVVCATHSANTQEKVVDPKAGLDSAAERWQTVRPLVNDKVSYLSYDGCAACHEKPTAAYEKQKRTEFVFLTESGTWTERDLHSYAYQALTDSELGKRMNKLLAWKTPDGKPRNTWESAECLACHSVDKRPEIPLAKKRERIDAEGGKVVRELYLTLGGVGCEACHGPSKDWFNDHVQAEETGNAEDPVRVAWRETKPAEKFKRGLIDLRDPKIRPRVCASCHIGNSEEGKFVTHEMYAAGHPPLPGFEVSTFSRDQPFHALPINEVAYIKKLAQAKPQDAWELFHYRTDEDYGARLAAIGAVAAFRESMNLIRGEAKRELEGKDDPYRSGALDFSHFDCYACHHDLQIDSERQKRGYEGVPGRPRMRPAATALLDAVVSHATEALGPSGAQLRTLSGELSKELGELNVAFDRRVYGDAKAVTAAAGKLVATTDRILGEVEKVKYTPAEKDKLIAKLVAAAANAKNKALYDYDAARQLAWVIHELGRDKFMKNPALTQQKQKLAAITPLQLRPTEKRPTIEEQLPGRYKSLYGYQAKPFFDVFADIAKLLPN